MPRQGKLLFGHQRAVAQPSVEIGGLVPSSLSAARVPELRFHQTTCGQGAGPHIVGLVLIGAGPDADRRAKLLIYQAEEGSISDAHLQL
jgi:hypothetical protein